MQTHTHTGQKRREKKKKIMKRVFGTKNNDEDRQQK